MADDPVPQRVLEMIQREMDDIRVETRELRQEIAALRRDLNGQEKSNLRWGIAFLGSVLLGAVGALLAATTSIFGGK